MSVTLAKKETRRSTGRRRWIQGLLALFAFACLVLPGVERALATQEVFEGRAVDSEGRLEYIERHNVTYEGGRAIRSVTTYTDGEGRIIGELISQSDTSPWVNTYGFRDLRAKYEDGVSVSGEKLLLYRKKGPEKETELKALPMQPGQVMGPGVNHFIRSNLEAIAGGGDFRIQLVLPSRLEQYGFQVRKLKLEGQRVYVRLEIDNWLLRLIAPHVVCEYDLSQRRLLRYVGISNLEDGSGTHKQVDITYRY